jgi:hypothetical protein
MSLPYYRPPVPPEPEPDPERPPDTKVHDWRLEQLRAAGWPPLLAEMLAVDHAVDLHQACGLLERGCTVERAWEILN